MQAEAEIPLSGGRGTPGVVRVGDTVRRPPRLNGEFTCGLLRHLDMVGFAGAPRFLGRDANGRDILSYLDGDVPADLGWHDDAVLTAAARLIREYHDATVRLVCGVGPGRTEFEVVCHNDLSPCNCVFRAGQPVALIDFDLAAPGTRRADLAYAAWCWLDIGTPAISADEQRHRLRLFLQAYGDDIDPAAVVATMAERQLMLAAEGECTGKQAMAEWARACRAWTSQNLCTPALYP
jgi:Phosphotransferase enzyme family